jgi:hypothetical protein
VTSDPVLLSLGIFEKGHEFAGGHHQMERPVL